MPARLPAGRGRQALCDLLCDGVGFSIINVKCQIKIEVQTP